MVSAPILRSPPFTWVSADVAAISVSHEAADCRSEAAAIAGQVARARVGGTFWGAAPDLPAAIHAWLPLADRQAARGVRGEPGLLITSPYPISPAYSDRLRSGGATVLIGVFDPWAILPHVRRVIAAPESEEAVLALLAGVPVEGIEPGSGEGLVASRLLKGVRFRDPFHGGEIDAAAAVALLAFWRDRLDRNRTIAVATGIAGWKRASVGRMLWNGEREPPFRAFAATAAAEARRRDGAVAVWPSRAPRGLAAAVAADRVPLASIEDGFVRSAGLGSDCVPPLSIVLDGQAPHYDPRRASDLETLIATTVFTPPMVARSEAMIARLIGSGIGKYARDAGVAVRPPGAARVVLVTGQVEDDESVRLGGGAVGGNLDLLRRARAEEPGAFLIFRPHPDVDAGHRMGHVPDRVALELADTVDRDTPITALYAMVDAVHVLTSLAGFEALLRRCEVVVHGQPFYAGWGLTRDLAPLARRTRRVSLAELVCAAILLYPHYLDPVTGLPCPAEVLVDRLVAGVRQPVSLVTRLRRLRRHLPRRSGRPAGGAARG